MNTGFLGLAVATVLTVYGIETLKTIMSTVYNFRFVATVLTVYGIETYQITSDTQFFESCNSTYRLRY